MRATRNALAAGCGWNRPAAALMPAQRIREFGPGKPKTLRALAKRFMAYRAAKLAADPSVDTFFNRSEHAARFAYFDE